MKNEKEILNQLIASTSETKETALENYREAIQDENETEGHYQRGRFEALAEIEAYLKAIGASN